MTNQAFDFEKDDSNKPIRANAFVKPIYRPSNIETEKRVRLQLADLGLTVNSKYEAALSSVLAACKSAQRKGQPLIAYPGDSASYTGKLYSWRIAKAVKGRLIEKGHLVKRTGQSKDHSIVYEVVELDVSGEFISAEASSVQVRTAKEAWGLKAKPLSKSDLRGKTGRDFRREKRRIDLLNGTYNAHPLCSPEGLSWGAAERIFNESRMDRGGRLYGPWQQLKPEDRLHLKINNEPLVEIDIVASCLFIVSAKGGSPIVSPDPYSDIEWVNEKTVLEFWRRCWLSSVAG